MKRVHSLDYLRGLMAVSVMLYHYISWGFPNIHLGGEYLIGKLGIYAVSVFYILSGLSLALVYDQRITSLSEVRSFFIKRLFRILPLFWLTTVTATIFLYVRSHILEQPFLVTGYELLINLTLTFGFLDHEKYISTGAWSIGNEIVFYILFPIVFLVANKYKITLILSCIISIFFLYYFSFEIQNPAIKLSDKSQWVNYIHPLNQIYLFFIGVLFGVYHTLWTNNKQINLLLLFGACATFYFYTIQGNQNHIVYGVNRVIFSVSCLITVFSIFKLDPTFHNSIARFLTFLGESCYSIYLLHPLVAMPIVFLGSKLGLNVMLLYVVSIFVTLIASRISFKYIEKPMILIGKKIANSQRKGAELPTNS